MSNLVGSITGAFSSKKSKQSRVADNLYQRSPFFTDTGASRVNGRSIRLDPSIRGIQDQALQDYAATFGDFGNAADRFLTQSGDLRGRTASDFGSLREGFGGLRGELGGLSGELGGVRSRYLGNQGSLMEARLRPIREQFGRLRASTQQDFGRRGLGGSSFSTGTLRDIDRERALVEGDVRAQTTADALGFERDILGQQAGLVGQQGQFLGAEADIAANLATFESQLNTQELGALNNAAQQRMQATGETLEIAKARLLQELGIFGLGQQGTERIRELGSGREKGFGFESKVSGGLGGGGSG